MNIKCPENHIFKMRYSSFNQGNRCPICYTNKRGDYTRFTCNQVKTYIESIKDYKLLSKEYKGAHTKLKVQCNKGHIFKITYANFQQGKRCPICNGGIKLTYNYVKTYIESFNYKLLSKEYKNNKTKLNIQCPENHIFKITYANFKKGSRCPVCWNESTSSKAEKEIQNYIVKNFPIRVIKNDRNTIFNSNTGYYLELDIYLPDLNKAIEYNGTYWHSLFDQKIKDKIKQNECKKLDIDLLIIEEKMFTLSPEKVYNTINKFIGE